MVEKVKYITNKEFLKHIHLSKNTYCAAKNNNKDYFNYDMIAKNVTDIDDVLILAAQTKRANQLMAEDRLSQKLKGVKNHAIVITPIAPESISKQSLIFRVMTFDHIPLDPDRKRKNRNMAESYAKTNFPPFQHYKFNENDELECIVKSHWKNFDDPNGFNVEHGRVTSTLASMYMLLVERLSRKSNWQGYSYRDEMQSYGLLQLCQVGLQFNEAVSDNPFSFYTTVLTNSFTRILNLEKRNQKIRDDQIEIYGLDPSYTRQTENEMASKGEEYYREVPKKKKYKEETED